MQPKQFLQTFTSYLLFFEEFEKFVTEVHAPKLRKSGMKWSNKKANFVKSSSLKKKVRAENGKKKRG